MDEHGPAQGLGARRATGLLSITLIWLVFAILVAAVIATVLSERRLVAERVRTEAQLATAAEAAVRSGADLEAWAAHVLAADPGLVAIEFPAIARAFGDMPTATHMAEVRSPGGTLIVIGLSDQEQVRGRLWGTLGVLASMGAVFVLMSVFLVIVLGRAFGRPLFETERRAARLARGELTSPGSHPVSGEFASIGERLEEIRLRMSEERVQAEDASSELRRINSLQRLMLRELNHRIRNNLASLTTLVAVSRAGNASVAEFAARIERRIEAMSSIHAMLSERQWSPVPLREMLERLAPHEAMDRISLAGPDLEVGASQATPLAMVFQEMFANAMEHGSLGSGAGWLSVRWDMAEEVHGDRLVIDWCETGGPPPDPSAEAGTGTTLIRGLIEGELRGVARLQHTQDGVAHHLTIPLPAALSREPIAR